MDFSKRKALVLGAGQMGVPIAHALKYLGHDVVLADNSQTKISGSKYFLEGFGDIPSGYLSKHGIYVKFIDINDKTINGFFTEIKPDIVVSALPYWLNLKIATHCINNSIMYCDLGGHLPTTENIASITNKSNCSFTTDLGLAPGLVNIVAERGCYLVGAPHAVLMAVGGLPEDEDVNILGYIPTWSISGLLNEYREQAQVLVDGKVNYVEPLTGLETIVIGEQVLEAFYTSGGIAHSIESLKRHGVKEASYKTLRYPGHAILMNFMLNCLKLSDDVMTKMFYDFSRTRKKDAVYLYVNVCSKDDVFFACAKAIFAGEKFSAMQRATGYSAAAAAQIMLDGTLRKEGFLDYAHFNTPSFYRVFAELIDQDSVYPQESKQWII